MGAHLLEVLGWVLGFPFPATSTMDTVGVTLEMHFALGEHYDDIMSKA